MKNVLLIDASPTEDGNGDALIAAAMDAARNAGANAQSVNVREQRIGYCRGCYGCAKDGVCVQRDDFKGLLKLAHEADAIIAVAPIYYNCMAAQIITVIDRLCCTFAYKSYALGPKKKVAFLLTCTGSDPDEMKRHVRNITTLPSISRAISETQTEVFTGCQSAATVRETPAYLEKAKSIGMWAVK